MNNRKDNMKLDALDVLMNFEIVPNLDIPTVKLLRKRGVYALLENIRATIIGNIEALYGLDGPVTTDIRVTSKGCVLIVHDKETDSGLALGISFGSSSLPETWDFADLRLCRRNNENHQIFLVTPAPPLHRPLFL